MKCEAIFRSCIFLALMTGVCRGLLHGEACNRTARTSVGWIRWTGRMGRCVVKIRAPVRDTQVVELIVRRLQVGSLRDSNCEGAYVQFSDGVEDLDDDVGRYCGHVIGNTTRLFLRRGPELRITMDSETRFAAENPVIFSAQFSVLPTRLAMERYGNSLLSRSECSLECSNRNYQRVCRITSPGYPGVYPRGLRCRIPLESTVGRFKIGGVSADAYNLMNYTIQDSCRTENCEEHVEDEFASRSRPEVEFEGGGEREIGRKRRRRRRERNFEGYDYPPYDEEDEIIIGEEDLRRRKISEKHGERSSRNGRRGGGGGGGGSRSGRRGDELGNKLINHRRHGERRGSGKKTNDSPEEDSNEEGWMIKNSPREEESTNPLFEQRFHRRHEAHHRSRRGRCVSDFLAIYEKIGGNVVEISTFCGQGRVPLIVSRGGSVIVEFHTERDGTVMHDGFHLTLQESRVSSIISSSSSSSSSSSHHRGCDYTYKSTDRAKKRVESFQHWYPPSTLCSYRFVGKASERVFLRLKINRDDDLEDSNAELRRNSSLDYCPGNEITVYNGAHSNDSLAWSYCDIFHSDINNIQVPVTSAGNVLLVQYYSLKGSLNGQEFTYGITYKFLKNNQRSSTRKKYVSLNETKTISLRPVNFSALNLTDYENCNCDFSTRIVTFKSWFIVLVVLGVISFVGAVFTIVALIVKCSRVKSVETKLLQTPKR